MSEGKSSVNISMDSKMDDYLLSKCTLSFNGYDAKKITSNTDDDLSSQKLGEILRSKGGRFTFSCTYCGAVCDSCQEIMDHINSHFDDENSSIYDDIKTSKYPLALPEFISTDEIEMETTLDTTATSNDVFQQLANVTPHPRPMNGSIPIKKTNSHTGVDSETPQKTKIVKVIKLKPVKILPRLRTYAERTRTFHNVDQKKCSTKSMVSPKIVTPPHSEIKDEYSLCDKEPVIADNYSGVKSENSAQCTKMSHTDFREKMRRERIMNRCYQCEMEPKISNPSDARRHICLFCKIWLPNHLEYDSHLKTAHNKDANNVWCNDFYCYICEKKFSFRNYLVGHLKIHTQTANHLCATCGSTFKTVSRLREHMKIHEDRTYECEQCGKIFKRFARLSKHLWCHNTNLSFVCKVCSKAFKMKRYLDRHMALHNGVKINCRYCDATFNFVSVRRAHEKARHNVV